MKDFYHLFLSIFRGVLQSAQIHVYKQPVLKARRSKWRNIELAKIRNYFLQKV